MKEYPYWWDTPALRAGGQKSEVRGHLPSRADVVVIGAGYTGLAAARQLARRGASVVVLERESVGWGASSRNGGQVLTGFKLEPAALVARLGESRARQLFDASLDAIAFLEQLIGDESIECEYERTGHIHAASKPSHFSDLREQQKLLAAVFNHHVELIPASEQRAELGSTAYSGLLIDKRSGALNPARYAAGLAAAARRASAAIVEGVEVRKLSRQAGRWSVATGQGAIDAGDVLVATNGYSGPAAPWLQRRWVSVGSFIIATEPLSAADEAVLVPRRRMVFDSRNFLHYFRFTRDSRLLFGGRALFTRPTEDTTRRSAEILKRDMVSVFPVLANVRVDYAWGGNVAFSRDQLPHAGRLEDAYYAGGYFGHGIAMATCLGDRIARRIAGEAVNHPLMDDHLATIPFYNGFPWFLPFAGAYYKIKDWLS